MANHPGRKPGRAQQRMTPEQFRDLLARANMTQQRAADLLGVELRTVERWAAGAVQIPRTASGLLCVLCILLGAPAEMMRPWLPREVADLIGAG